MWWGSGSDPGGSSGGEGSNSKEQPSTSNQEDMKERYEQQQILLAQLKEMLRKSEQSSSVSREKVEEYASTLSEINARTKLSKLKRSEGRKPDTDDQGNKSTSGSNKKSNISTPAKEKINLLQQQLEENKVKLAQRNKNQKDIEKMVNELKTQLDSQIIATETKLPVLEKSSNIANLTIDSSKEDLLAAIKCKDDHITELTEKTKQLQANVLDLQENIKEKDSVIDARTKAITLLSENLSKKGKNTLDMLDETKEQMRNMQTNFVQLESDMKEKNNKLQSELVEKNNKIAELLKNLNVLESNCAELQSSNLELHSRLTNCTVELEKYKLDLIESETKVSELAKLNDLQCKLMKIDSNKAQKSEISSPQKATKRDKGKNKKSNLPETTSVETRDSETKPEPVITKEQEAKVKIDEVTKLNKQLEEMNKNMIKMKAQHKAKLKELQKKTSPSELSDKVSNLESENTKLVQRIAELEDKKEKEYIAALENKIEDQNMEIENHIRTITALELQITKSSNEISSLRSELSNLMHLENAQVCSEMTSVQLEEQLDKEVSQKKEIHDKYNEIIKENENLLEKIELLNKEKQELSAKLDNYMQENIELIDRLEKLSAEKVSSAESIEIVESLTQQEKLEIEAYQKSLEFGSEKQSEDNIELEHQESDAKSTEETSPSELLERIELFTVERREVMDKMDNLTAENQQLHIKFENMEKKYEKLCNENESLVSDNRELSQKLKSFEEVNNEKLQDELTEYRALLENQKLQINSLQEELWNKPDEDLDYTSQLTEEKNKLQGLNESLASKLDSLQNEYKILLNKKDNNAENELIHARSKIIELENKITENIDEINFLQSNIEDNKTELVKAAEKIVEYSNSIDIKNSEIEALKNETEEFQQIILELNNELAKREYDKQEEISVYSTQIEEFQCIISEHINQLQEYKSEMQKNSQIIEELNDQIENLNYKIIENQHEIELKNSEILTLKSLKSDYETRIQTFEQELREKNNTFTETCRQLKEKCKFLENQIESNTGTIETIRVPFESKIQELEGKNKEQVEKMKKFAINLKKKTAICQELESQLIEIKERLESEIKSSNEKQQLIDKQLLTLQENEQKTHYLINQLQENETELSKLQLSKDSLISELDQQKENYELQIRELNNERKLLEHEFHEFTSTNIKLQDELSSSIEQHESLQKSFIEKDKIIENLYTEMESIKSDSARSNTEKIQNLLLEMEEMKLKMEATQNALEAKLQEKDLFIENLEADNNKYKERIFKLEEGLSNIEERRQSLEERAFDLSVQLEEKSFACEEASQSEDILEQRLLALVAHDEIINRKLHQSTQENQTLNDKIKNLLKENDELQQKINETHSKLQESSQNNLKIEFLENECSRLTNIIVNLENDLKKSQTEYEKNLNKKNNEIENMEIYLNSQIQELHNERKSLLNRCELLQDNIKEYVENEQLLNDEIKYLQQNLTTIKEELELKLSENEKLNKANVNNLLRLEQLENQLLNLQKVPVEKLDTHSLNVQLNRLELASQEDIDVQTVQQKMAITSLSATPSTKNIFDSSVSNTDILENPSLENISQYDSLQQQIHDLTEQLYKSQEYYSKCINLEQQVHNITEQLNSAQVELNQSQAQLNEIQELYKISQQELTNQKIISTNLQQELTTQTDLLVRKTAEVNVTQIISTAEQKISQEQKQKFLGQEHIVETIQKPVENMTDEESKQELVRKIKALEFMLFNIEKEKDDTLVQCHQFTNELIHLVYERERLLKYENETNQPKIDLQSLETEIVALETTDKTNSKELHDIEFSTVHFPANKDRVDNSSVQVEPIVEEVIQPKTAYLCYTDYENETNQPKIDLQSLETEIVTLETTDKTDSKELHEIEFSTVHFPVNKGRVDNSSAQLEPVAEEVIQPKTAYLCYTDDENKTELYSKEMHDQDPEKLLEQKASESIDSHIVLIDEMKSTSENNKPYQKMELETVDLPKDSFNQLNPININVDTFASEEDGWGWNAEEAKLEAEHRQSLDAVTPLLTNSKVEMLEQKVLDLELERSKLLEEAKTNQIRCGKLIKKMKLMKEKYDKLLVETNENKSSDDFGLDMAIQDELNNQIKILEHRIKELTDGNSKEKAEKENLLKRLDVLQGANDCMIEFKEKTDNEIQFLQMKNRELSLKLEQLEWGDDSPNKSTTNIEIPCKGESTDELVDYKKQCEELNKKVAELNTTINDLILDNEEMQLLLEEQRVYKIDAEKTVNMKSEQEYLKVENENRNLIEELAKLNEIKLVLENKILNYIEQNGELSAKTTHLQSHIENLIQENNMMNNQAQLRIEQLQNEYIELQNQLATTNAEAELLKKNQIELTNAEIVNLKEEISKLTIEKRDLETVYFEKEVEMKNRIESCQSEITLLKEELFQLQNEKHIIENALVERQASIEHLNFEIQQLEAEKSSLDLRLEQVLSIQSTNNTIDEKLPELNKQLLSSITELECKNKELTDLNNALNIEKLEFEHKLSVTIEQLAQEWSEKVDQRGNDIAESWKLHLESVENEFSQREQKLKSELSEILYNNEEIIIQNNELQKQVEILISEKQAFVSNNNNIIQTLQQTINNNQSEILEVSQKLKEANCMLEQKNNEISNLKQSFESIQNNKFELEEVIAQLENTKIEYEHLEDQLQIKEERCQDLEHKLNELNILSEEDANQISDLKNIIENQVLKLEELKNNLEEKNNDYNKLVEEFSAFERTYLKGEPTKLLNESVQNSKNLTDQALNPEIKPSQIEANDSNSAVNRAEIDLALYMLHQRDVRCEELTVELMQLLEERDILQLKLSNEIRLNEEFRAILNSQNLTEKDNKDTSPKTGSSTGAIPKTRTTVTKSKETEIPKESIENITPDITISETEDNLSKKLSQLRSIGYRDKTLKDDQESRYIQQMSLMQQHRDITSKLPPEAAARLMDANYTLTRDVQSPSKVLLNWLWGRSTPEVNDV